VAWKPTLTVTVEYEGAEFDFESPDNALARYSAIISRRMMAAARGRDLSAMNEEERREFAKAVEQSLQAAMPDELGEVYADLFCEGVRAWRGVEDADGKPIPCDAVNRRRIPYADKVAIGDLYLRRINEIDEGKGPAPSPPTTCAPGETHAANPSEVTTQRVQDSASSTDAAR
jgi:hypothetical protein